MRSRELRQEIIRCVGFAGSAEERVRPLRGFSRREWESSLDWLNLSGLALTFWNRLQGIGAENDVPAFVSALLAESLSENRRRVDAMMPEFDLLNQRFERAGIEYVVWKGFALVPEYCPDASLRPTYDYDYLIHLGRWNDAREVLEAAGYFPKQEGETGPHLTFVQRRSSLRAAHPASSLYAPTLERKVELHLTPWDEEAFRISLEIPHRPWDRKIRRSWRGITFFSLTPQDTFVYQTVHAFQHILHNWCRLGWLFEIAYYLEHRAADSTFWEDLTQSLGNNSTLREITALVISLASALFGARVPIAVKSKLTGAMRSQVALWLRHYGIRAALDNFSRDKSSLLLYREFVPDESAWKQIRRSRLLPVHRPNRVPGAAAVSRSNLIPQRWTQAWYVMTRLIHHSLRGASYAWESARWSRLRRLSADRVLSQG